MTQSEFISFLPCPLDELIGILVLKFGLQDLAAREYIIQATAKGVIWLDDGIVRSRKI